MAGAQPGPPFFRRTSTFAQTMSERERTVVEGLLESQSRHATRLLLNKQDIKEVSNSDNQRLISHQTQEEKPQDAAGNFAETQENGAVEGKQASVKKGFDIPAGLSFDRHARQKVRGKRELLDLATVTDPRNSTDLTQMQLQMRHCFYGSWSQQLYSIVCQQLKLQPRQYLFEALAHPQLVLANKFSRSEEILSVAVSLTDNDAITSLSFVDNKLDTKSVAYLCHAVWQNLKVSSMTLAGNELTDEGLSIVVELLTETRNLKIVSLRDNRIRDVHGPQIAEVLLHNSSIEDFDLSYNQLGDAAARDIGPALAENDTIKHFNLSWNCFRPIGVKLLARQLNENITLRELNLRMNGLGLEGAGYIAKYLVVNETLLRIDISGNRISDYGFDLLAKMLVKNCTLKELCLGNNTVSTAGVLKVLQAFKDNEESGLRILDFEGLYMDQTCKDLADELKRQRNLCIISNLQGTVGRTELKKREMIRGIIDHDSPLEILRFYVEQTGSRLVDVFNLFDTEKKNAITKSDLTRGLENINVILTQDQVDILFNELDYDKSGDIDFGELMAGDREARKNLRKKGKFRAAPVNLNATPDFADI